MINMDFKGITWVGHVYEKFEAMCLEVEEVMYQDTVKYVENQVQTVGSSVKKFYSGVMQDVIEDLLLPSSFEKYAETSKKSNVGLKEDDVKGDGEQLTEDSKVIPDAHKKAAHVPTSCQLHTVDNIFESCTGSFVEGASSDLLSGEHNNRSTPNKSNVDNLLPAETSSEGGCVENEFSRMLSFCGNANANHEVSCHQITTTLTPVSGEEDHCDSMEESSNEIKSASDSIPDILTDSLHLVEKIKKKEMEMRCSSSIIESAESNGKLNWTMDTSGCSAVGRNEIDTVQQLEKLRVDESCIMVNGAELHFHPQRESKHKPYQKKIRDAISSRMRSARKKEYEQLALWYGDDVKSDQVCEGVSMSAQKREDTRRSHIHEVMDSEWELL